MYAASEAPIDEKQNPVIATLGAVARVPAIGDLDEIGTKEPCPARPNRQ